MKAFICSIIIFSVLLFLIIANSIYIHRTADKLIEQASSLSIDGTDEIQKLCSLWQSHKLIFSISMHDAQVEKVTELTENIKSAASADDSAEFQKNVTLLIELLEDIKKMEEVSLHGIV